MAKKLTRADSPLFVGVIADELVFSVGIRTLKEAVERAPFANPYNEKSGAYDKTVLITQPSTFARFFAAELQREREDGATPLDLFLDEMAEKTLEQGPLGVRDPRERKVAKAVGRG